MCAFTTLNHIFLLNSFILNLKTISLPHFLTPVLKKEGWGSGNKAMKGSLIWVKHLFLLTEETQLSRHEFIKCIGQIKSHPFESLFHYKPFKYKWCPCWVPLKHFYWTQVESSSLLLSLVKVSLYWRTSCSSLPKTLSQGEKHFSQLSEKLRIYLLNIIKFTHNWSDNSQTESPWGNTYLRTQSSQSQVFMVSTWLEIAFAAILSSDLQLCYYFFPIICGKFKAASTIKELALYKCWAKSKCQK